MRCSLPNWKYVLVIPLLQSLNMYVPPDETVQELGEINMAYQQGAAGGAAASSGTAMQNPVYGK